MGKERQGPFWTEATVGTLRAPFLISIPTSLSAQPITLLLGCLSVWAVLDHYGGGEVEDNATLRADPAMRGWGRKVSPAERAELVGGLVRRQVRRGGSMTGGSMTPATEAYVETTFPIYLLPAGHAVHMHAQE